MNENKKFVLAVGFSFLILLLYPVYLKWITPKSVSGENAILPTTQNQITNNQSQSPTAVPQTKPETTENIYHFSNQHFNVEFSDRGATITKLALTRWGKTTKGSEAILINKELVHSGAFVAAISGQGIDFEDKIFTLENLDTVNGEVQFVAQEAGKWLLRKKFRFDPNQPVFWLDIETQNLSSNPQSRTLELSSHLISGRDIYNARETFSFVSLQDKLISTGIRKIQKKPLLTEGKILWQALTRHFFTLIICPDTPATLVNTSVSQGDILITKLQFEPQAFEPNQSIKQSFFVYVGPKYYRQLKSFGHGFEQILSQGFFGIFKLWLLLALQWTHKVVGNYGWTIVLVTVAIKLLFTPLTHMSFESMKKMQALQPKIKALQEHHKNDQAKLSKEMMELYKRNKVNPMSGCLPMIFQIPVFIAFYQVLAQTAELQGEPFIFWIRDLSEPDHAWMLPFALPILGDAINILPFLMIGSMIWQQRLTPQSGAPEQQKMMMFMPIVFGVMFYKLPSGLVLYWFVNNLLSIFHQLFIKGKALPHHEE